MIQKWYEETLGISPRHRFDSHEFTIYKGFKITLEYESDIFFIEDVRFNDFYKEPSPKVIQLMESKGFIKAVDDLVFERDQSRYKRYKARMERLYEDIKVHKKKLKSDHVFFTKKITNARENILKYSSLVAFYRVRISQHKKKYNLI